MPTSKLISSLYLLSLILLFPYVFGAVPIFENCPAPDYFTSNDPYETNLKMLMGYLSHKTPPTGSNFTSMGKDQYQVYGLALCRGNLSHVGCANCVSEVTSHVRENCPEKKAATIWYDNCLLRYSNKNFFGLLDDETVVCATHTVNGSEPVSVRRLVTVNKFLRELAKKAPEMPQMYATGNLMLSGSRKLHGSVQCTRDLSRSNCTKCLDEIIKHQLRPSCCTTQDRNCRVMSSSCFVRYRTSVLKTKGKIAGCRK